MAVVKHWYGTLAAYTAISSKDGGTLYHTSDGGIYRGAELVASKTVYSRPSVDDLTTDASFVKGVTVMAGDGASNVGTYGLYDTVLTVGPFAWRSFQLKSTKSDSNGLWFRNTNAQATSFNEWSSVVLQALDGSITLPLGTALTYGVESMPPGSIRFGNGSASNEFPTITGKSTSVTYGAGLQFLAATANTNTLADMRFNVRLNTNADYTTLTNDAFLWSRYGTTLMTMKRNGLLTLLPATNSLSGASQQVNTHEFSLNSTNIPTYSTRRTDSGVGMILMSMVVNNNQGGTDMMFNVREQANTDFSASYRTQSAFSWNRYGTILMNLLRNGNLSVLGSITSSSTMTSTGFYQSSLRALKKNIKPFNKSALDILNRVDVMTYRYRNDDGNQHVGIIADDSHELLAGKNHDHFDQGNATGLLIKAVQELTERCNKLEAELKKRQPC